MTTSQPSRLDELLSALCDGSIDADRFAELEQLLAADPQHRRRYLEFVLLHGELHWDEAAGHARKATDPPQSAAPTDAPSRGETPRPTLWQQLTRPTPLSLTIAALAMCLLLTAMAFMAAPFYRTLTRDRSIPTVDPYTIVAEVVAIRDAEWIDENQSLHRGAFLVGGSRINLKKGLVKVSYRDGATVTLQGPCRFTVEQLGAGTLDEGQLVANVPESAIGFRIDTPTLTVVDLGTQFAVEVDDGQAVSVDVLTGRVRAAARQEEQQEVELAAGQSLRFDKSWRVLLTTEAQRKELLSIVRAADMQRITGVKIRDVSSELTGRFDRRAVYLIDGSGLTRSGHSPLPDSAVPGGGQGNMWLTNGTLGDPHDPLPAHVTIDLGRAYELSGMQVWNYNEQPNGFTSRGARDVRIEVSPTNSVDDLVLLSTSSGDFVFPQATGQADYSGFNVPLDEVTKPEALQRVRLVRMTILSTHGNNPQEDDENLTGLSEVQFTGRRLANPPRTDNSGA